MAAGRLGDLVIDIRANLAPFQASARLAENEAQRAGGSAGARFAAAFRNAGAAFATAGIGVAAMQVATLTDKYRELQNSLKVAGLAGGELTRVYAALTAQAEKNYAPVEALVGLFSSTSQAAKDLGASTDDVLKFTNTVAQAMRIAGTNPEAASGALMQLGQMLGSSRVQAEEFNSVAEAIRPLMQAAADGIEEAGGSISKLKQLVNDGRVSNKAFFEGAQVGAQKFEEKLAGSATTIGGSLTNVKTAFLNLMGALDNQSGFTDDVVFGFNKLGEAIKIAQGIMKDSAPEFDKVGGFLDSVKAKLDGLAESAGRLTGLSNIGKPINKFFGSADYSNDMDGLSSRPTVDALERQLKRLSEQRHELQRSMGDQPQFATTIASLGDQIAKVTSRIEEMRAAAGRAGLDSSARAIIDASPVGNLPEFNIPGAKTGPAKYKLGDKENKGDATAAKRQADGIKELIADLEDEWRVIALSNTEREVQSNLRRVNADAASKEGQRIRELTTNIEAFKEAQDKAAAARDAMFDSAQLPRLADEVATYDALPAELEIRL